MNSGTEKGFFFFFFLSEGRVEIMKCKHKMQSFLPLCNTLVVYLSSMPIRLSELLELVYDP